MVKLKQCPFCGREAQITDGGYSGKNFFVGCISFRADNDFDCPAKGGIIRETREEAENAWNTRATEPKARVLSLEELKELKDNPVWIEQIGVCDDEDDLGTNDWGQVTFAPNKEFPRVKIWRFGLEHYDDPLVSNYGKTWLAYDHEPVRK